MTGLKTMDELHQNMDEITLIKEYWTPPPHRANADEVAFA